jgi:hypothetical protein
MLPRDVPEGSRTYHAYRMAYQHEYMVPIEVAWAMEQEIAALKTQVEEAQREARFYERVKNLHKRLLHELREATEGGVA